MVDPDRGQRRNLHAPARHHRGEHGAAGVLADRLGRRRVFAAGLVIFTVAWALAGFAPDPTFLNLSRGLQGVGGAIMFAVSLAMIAQEFKPGRERGMAMGVYGATIGVSVAFGP